MLTTLKYALKNAHNFKLVAPRRRGMAEWDNGTMAIQQYGTMAEWQ